MVNKKANSNRKRQESGFTLIEILITIIVLGLVITSLADMYYVVQTTEAKSLAYDSAVRAARTEIEDLRNNGYDTLTAGSTITFTPTIPSNLPITATGSVLISEPMHGLRRVDVTVTYVQYGQTINVELSSEIGIIGLGQG